jgi:hypothetical protein
VDDDQSPTVVNTAETGIDNGSSDDGVFPQQTSVGHTVDYAAMLGCNLTVKYYREQMIEYLNVTHMCVSKNMVCMVF